MIRYELGHIFCSFESAIEDRILQCITGQLLHRFSNPGKLLPTEIVVPRTQIIFEMSFVVFISSFHNSIFSIPSLFMLFICFRTHLRHVPLSLDCLNATCYIQSFASFGANDRKHFPHSDMCVISLRLV